MASRRLLTWGGCLLLGAQVLFVSAQATEASLRVAFVYNFLKFIEWPAVQTPRFNLCAVNAQDAARESLAQLNNKNYQSQQITIVYLDQVADIASQLTQCQLVYVPVSGADFQLPQAFPAGVLLVMDEANPDDARVGISLLRTAGNRIEFVMNEQAIQHAGVKVSSQLLKLAKKRREGGN